MREQHSPEARLAIIGASIVSVVVVAIVAFILVIARPGLPSLGPVGWYSLAAVAWIFVFGVLGWLVGARKDSETFGAILGVLLGPLGVLIAALIDNRPMCQQCGTRLNASPKICPGCREAVIDSTL